VTPYQIAPRPNVALIERIRSRCIEDKLSGCWIYKLSANGSSYANTMRWAHDVGGDGTMVQSSRLAWMALRGPIPDRTLQIDHLCRSRLCLNPYHLDLVKPTVNLQRRRVGEELPLFTYWFGTGPKIEIPTKVEGLWDDTGETVTLWEAA
jgi:hypothetical protein